MKSTIIFDLDGTLIDTPRAIVETFIATLKSINMMPGNPSAIRETIGLPLEVAFANLLNLSPDHGLVIYAVKQYQILFKEIVLPKATELIFPGVDSGLTELKSHGFKLAIATNKLYSSAVTLLEAAGLSEYFTLVVGANQVKNPKPHPEMGLLIMEKLKARPYNTIMIGDTTHDLKMAKGASMHSIAVTYGIHDVQKLTSAEPTWIADDFSEVIDYIKIGSLLAENYQKSSAELIK